MQSQVQLQSGYPEEGGEGNLDNLEKFVLPLLKALQTRGRREAKLHLWYLAHGGFDLIPLTIMDSIEHAFILCEAGVFWGCFMWIILNFSLLDVWNVSVQSPVRYDTFDSLSLSIPAAAWVRISPWPQASLPIALLSQC